MNLEIGSGLSIYRLTTLRQEWSAEVRNSKRHFRVVIAIPRSSLAFIDSTLKIRSASSEFPVF